MVWIPGIDYPSAQQHVDYPVPVLVDGTDTAATPLRISDNTAVTGWRAGCDCGWPASILPARGEWPSSTGAVPAAVEGRDGGAATCEEWVRHVQQAVPELSIYELACDLADTAPI